MTVRRTEREAQFLLGTMKKSPESTDLDFAMFKAELLLDDATREDLYAAGGAAAVQAHLTEVATEMVPEAGFAPATSKA